jgi:hypothetical protein
MILPVIVFEAKKKKKNTSEIIEIAHEIPVLNIVITSFIFVCINFT